MDSKTFCPLPWLQLASTTDGYYRPCCEFKWNQKNKTAHWSNDISDYNYKIKNIKQQLLSSETPIECNQCWNLENKGVESLRIQSLKNFLFQKHLDYGIVSVDMKLGNLCNLGCRMCEPHSSSVLQNEIKNYSNYEWTEEDLDSATVDYAKNNWVQIALQKLTNIDTIRHFKFTGGEPFAIPDIINYLNSIQNPEIITLEFLTNGLLLNDKKIKILNKFKKTILHVSCDGIKNLYNYIRWPGNWQEFENKLDYIKNYTNFEVNISITVNAYNVFLLPEIFQYFTDRKINYFIIVVNTPKYLHPMIYPDDLKQKIFEKYKNYGFEKLQIVLKHDILFDNNLYDQFIKQTKIKDKIRNQTFDAFGELHEI